jgi:hypothetical protein
LKSQIKLILLITVLVSSANSVAKDVKAFIVYSANIEQSLTAPGEVIKNNGRLEVIVRVDVEDIEEYANTLSEVRLTNRSATISWNAEYLRKGEIKIERGHSSVPIFTSLGSKSPPLAVGARVDVELVYASVKDATAVPYKAIFLFNDKPHVARLLNNKIHYIPVKLGLEDFWNIQILKGVSVGEVLIVPYEGMQDGKVVDETSIIDPNNINNFP